MYFCGRARAVRSAAGVQIKPLDLLVVAYGGTYGDIFSIHKNRSLAVIIHLDVQIRHLWEKSGQQRCRCNKRQRFLIYIITNTIMSVRMWLEIV